MSEKHKRNITHNITDEKKEETLSNVETMIDSLAPKQQHIMAEWIDTWCKYIEFEKSFIPAKLKYYKRGEIVLAHFGYNVGSELGGVHYAIVIENNNNKADNTVVVVPLSSLGEGKSEDDLHNSEVFLGKLFPDTDKLSYARPKQVKCISKLRIIKPKYARDGVRKISSEQLTQIDDKIKMLFTRK